MPRTNPDRVNPWVLIAIAVGLIAAVLFLYNGHPVRDSNLYSPHAPAWVAVVMFVLSKYFDNELTALFLKDAECQKREQGVCNLDFDPIYDAQDFEKTTNLQIAAVKGQPDLFKVTFTNLGTRTLVHKLTNTPSGWRISDIKYSEGPSLKETLSHEVK
jgi:hypothetical protein